MAGAQGSDEGERYGGPSLGQADQFMELGKGHLYYIGRIFLIPA